MDSLYDTVLLCIIINAIVNKHSFICTLPNRERQLENVLLVIDRNNNLWDQWALLRSEENIPLAYFQHCHKLIIQLQLTLKGRDNTQTEIDHEKGDNLGQVHENVFRYCV